MKVPWLKVHVLTDKRLEEKLEAAKSKIRPKDGMKTRELGNARIVKLTGQVVRLEMIIQSLMRK